MTLLEGLQKQVSLNLKGVQVYRKENIIDAAIKHNLFYVNNIKLNGDYLILEFDDITVRFKLTWRTDDLCYTLTNIEYDKSDKSSRNTK